MQITNKAGIARDRNERRELFRTALQLIGGGLIERLRAVRAIGAASTAKPGSGPTEGDHPNTASSPASVIRANTEKLVIAPLRRITDSRQKINVDLFPKHEKKGLRNGHVNGGA